MSESIKKIVMISVCIVISFFMSMIVVNTIPVMASTGTVPALKGTYYQSADSSRYIVVQTTDMQCYKVKSGSFRFSAVDGTGHIGINATVKNNIKITNNCIVGAGAVVVKSIEKSGVYIGVPAKIKE